MNIAERVNNFDFDTSNSHDVAVLLEQVFMYHDGRAHGGTIALAQTVLNKYEASIRSRTVPELHASTSKQLREMRSSLVQMETALQRLERDSSHRP